MKFRLNNKYFRWGLTAFIVIAAAIIFYYFVFHSSNILAGINRIIDVLMPVVFGLATAYIMTPVLNYIEKKLLIPLCDRLKIPNSPKRRKIIRGISIFFTAFIFIATIYLLFYMMISQLVPSIQNIIVNFSQYRVNVINWANKILEDNPDINNNIQQVINQYSDQLNAWIRELPANINVWLRTVTDTATSILGMFWDFIIGFILAIYILSSKEMFASQAKKVVFALFERDTANITIRNFRFTHRTFIGFLGGKIADSVIIGLLCFVGTALMQTPYAALVSIIIGVTNVIPFFGPYLGAIPSIFLIFIVDPMHPLNCVYFAIFILVLQQFDGNILGPKILGNSTGLTSFWVIFAITFFGGFFGVLGMIVGVPVFAVIYAAIKSLINSMLRKKDLPIEHERYEKLDYIDDDGFHELQPALVENNQIYLKGRKNRKVSAPSERPGGNSGAPPTENEKNRND